MYFEIQPLFLNRLKIRKLIFLFISKFMLKTQHLSICSICSKATFLLTIFLYFYLGGTDIGKKNSRKITFNIAFKGSNRYGQFLASFNLPRKQSNSGGLPFF